MRAVSVSVARNTSEHLTPRVERKIHIAPAKRPEAIVSLLNLSPLQTLDRELTPALSVSEVEDDDAELRDRKRHSELSAWLEPESPSIAWLSSPPQTTDTEFMPHVSSHVRLSTSQVL